MLIYCGLFNSADDIKDRIGRGGGGLVTVELERMPKDGLVA